MGITKEGNSFLAIPYYKGIGSMYCIPRYDGQNHHVVGATREDWVKESIQKRKHFSIYCIFGEISSLSSIKMVFDNPVYLPWCDSINIVFGPKLSSETIKSEFVKLLNIFPDKLKLFSCSYRPADHGLIINDNIIYEQFHKPGVGYENAIVIEHADKNAQDIFMSSFNSHKASAKEITKDNIDKVKTEV